jgi:hypothetical protein
MQLLGSTSYGSLWRSMKYAIKRNRPRLPRVFIEALIATTVCYALASAVAIADLYLHQHSQTVIVARTFLGGNGTLEGYGVAFNQSFNNPDFSAASSGWRDWWANRADLANLSWLVATNASSAPFSVVTLKEANDAAVMVSPLKRPLTLTLSTSISYVAHTVGARANCSIITPRCASTPLYKDQTAVTSCAGAGWNYLPICARINDDPIYGINCTNSAYQNRTTGAFASALIDTLVLGADSDGKLFGSVTTTNGFPTGPYLLMNSPNDTSNGAPGYPNNPRLQVQIHLPGTNVKDVSGGISALDASLNTYAGCDFAYFAGIVHYDTLTDSFTLFNTSSIPNDIAAILWSPLVSQAASGTLAGRMAGVLLTGSLDDATAALNQEMGRQLIAMSGSLLMATSTISSSVINLSVVGQYSTSAVFILLGLLYAYGALAAILFLAWCTTYTYSVTTSSDSAPIRDPSLLHDTSSTIDALSLLSHPYEAFRKRDVPAAVLVQTWLTTPYPLIASSYNIPNGKLGDLSISQDPADMVDDRHGVRRLEIGIYRSNGEAVFGLKHDENSQSIDQSIESRSYDVEPLSGSNTIPKEALVSTLVEKADM